MHNTCKFVKYPPQSLEFKQLYKWSVAMVPVLRGRIIPVL